MRAYGIKFFPKSKEVAKILEQVPKGARSLFIEQAILDFASKSPSINFFFEGITKPKRKRRSQAEMAQSKVADTQSAPKAVSQSIASENKDGDKMMFNFNKMGLKQ